jgi:hypothetical protein
MVNMNIDSVVDYLSDDESDSEMPAGCVSLIKRICFILKFCFLYVEFRNIESST